MLRRAVQTQSSSSLVLEKNCSVANHTTISSSNALHTARRAFITRLFGPRRDPIYYSKFGHPDMTAEYFNSGRADMEWIKLRILCACTTTATWGVWLYGVYFPEKVKQYRDEPWSPLSD